LLFLGFLSFTFAQPTCTASFADFYGNVYYYDLNQLAVGYGDYLYGYSQQAANATNYWVFNICGPVDTSYLINPYTGTEIYCNPSSAAVCGISVNETDETDLYGAWMSLGDYYYATTNPSEYGANAGMSITYGLGSVCYSDGLSTTYTTTFEFVCDENAPVANVTGVIDYLCSSTIYVNSSAACPQESPAYTSVSSGFLQYYVMLFIIIGSVVLFICLLTCISAACYYRIRRRRWGYGYPNNAAYVQVSVNDPLLKPATPNYIQHQYVQPAPPAAPYPGQIPQTQYYGATYPVYYQPATPSAPVPQTTPKAV